jgi:hypothetical protein
VIFYFILIFHSMLEKTDFSISLLKKKNLSLRIPILVAYALEVAMWCALRIVVFFFSFRCMLFYSIFLVFYVKKAWLQGIYHSTNHMKIGLFFLHNYYLRTINLYLRYLFRTSFSTLLFCTTHSYPFLDQSRTNNWRRRIWTW